MLKDYRAGQKFLRRFSYSLGVVDIPDHMEKKDDVEEVCKNLLALVEEKGVDVLLESEDVEEEEFLYWNLRLEQTTHNQFLLDVSNKIYQLLLAIKGTKVSKNMFLPIKMIEKYYFVIKKKIC